MLKDILLQTAELINRDDLIDALNSDNITSQSIQNDILRLISYYNYTIENLCENYFNITTTQTITSDKNRKINYLYFIFKPIKIISITKDNKPIFYSEFSKFILLPQACTSYDIQYKYIPDRITCLTDKVRLPKGVMPKTVCYGIASEFTASKNQQTQAEYWNNKFMLEIFKSKTSKDRKLKQTFLI